MSQSLEEAAAYSGKWLEIIQKDEVSVQDAKTIIEESKTNFAEYFNRVGWIIENRSLKLAIGQ